jgi:signal transduction histidine kinase
VQDFGCGIPANKLSSLFVNFGTLAEHQNSNPSGRGLGLSICKSIVEKMGGSVAVESIVGEGTKFNLTFTAVCHLSSTGQFEENKSSVIQHDALNSSYRS